MGALQKLKSYFFILCFVGLLWFRGFVFIISSEFHRLFIKVLVLFAIGFFVIDLNCSILFNLSNFELLLKKKKKKEIDYLVTMRYR